jgi:hypothetical protein
LIIIVTRLIALKKKKGVEKHSWEDGPRSLHLL